MLIYNTMTNKKEEFLNKLKKENRIKNDYIVFKGFVPFRITDYRISNIDRDEVFFIKSENRLFEFWTRESVLIPPWKTYWFQLNGNILVKLKDGLLNKLLEKAIKKASNTFRLSKILNMSYPTFYNLRNKKNIEMISIKKLRRLLSFLNISYMRVNEKIEYTRKTKVISIKNPRFPINLASKQGALLLGYVVSDGHITLDRKSRNTLRTGYCGEDKEAIENFKESINAVYGKVSFQKERIRNSDKIRVGTSIIGSTLLKVGAILGDKATVNKHVPWLIKDGPKMLKVNYLRATFSDEGSVYPDKKGFIILSRYLHINPNDSQLKELRKLENKMRPNKFPTGHVNKRITVKKALDNIKDDGLKNLLNSKPKLLTDESELLKGFNIETRLWNRYLDKTTLGFYSLCCDMFVSKKQSINIFYNNIGFTLKDKQQKLVQLINNMEMETC